MAKLKLSDAELDLYQVNLAMRGAQLEARLLENGLDFAGSARIGGGQREHEGTARMARREALRQVRARRARTCASSMCPKRRSMPSPDLDFKIEGRRIEVTGRGEGAVREDRAGGSHECRARVVGRSAGGSRAGGSFEALRGDHRHLAHARREGEHRHARPHRAPRRARSLCAAARTRSRAGRASFRSKKASTRLTGAGSTSSAAGWCSAAGR